MKQKLTPDEQQGVALLEKLIESPPKNEKAFFALLKKFPKENGDMFAKDALVGFYRKYAGQFGLPEFSQYVVAALRMKPTRTISGVAPVTVLTKPFPCPGKCIFCPNDIRMPKSYLSDEPGAQRAERNYFDPYLQTYNRLQALHNIGHRVDKTEIIILGGTWSYYPEQYQIWFVKECFRALNEFGFADGRKTIEKKYQKIQKKYSDAKKYAASSNPKHNKSQLEDIAIHGSNLHKSYNRVVSELYVAPEKLSGVDALQSASWQELEAEQKKNEMADVRCVGLVIETRPDNISEEEVLRIRRLGCTKTQIGVQSLQDEVLTKNKRGHDVAATRRAFRLLRQAGLKIHAHWMANLYGSSVTQDKDDFAVLFSDPDFKPDELKLYPCSLVESAELMGYHQKNLWRPYTHDELSDVVSFGIAQTPYYCRLSRVIRDIPSQDIVVGNKLTNFRQIAEQELEKQKIQPANIRAREIRNEVFGQQTLDLRVSEYETSVSQEYFLEYVAQNELGKEKLLGFLRLSAPSIAGFISELEKAAVIREIHVYGQLVPLGKKNTGNAQHLGLGTRLIEKAAEIARECRFEKLSVISAVGTREYYRKKGFADGELYQHQVL
ncbi:MAG: tRNA uridine(34) 5-carboxymethylaminomethyl modification radical SAM/GNAT enzyme Elp3 [Pseudomonadales bacterium]|nr:tRNA uridine(34) 5-carboxymethylaminomethyl modification radical SAM/GNAT enzyme Elp3 [Pseudomonadales bacterium]